MKRISIVAFVACALMAGAPALLRGQNQTATAPAGTSPAPNAGPSLDDALHLYRTGKFADAVQEYQSLTSGPQAVFAYTGLARCYLRLKDPENAYNAANKAMEVAPRAPDAQVALGEVYFRQGKIPEAEELFVKVINSGAQNARAYLGLAHVSAVTALFAREKRMLDQAYALDPEDPDIRPAYMSTLTPGERAKGLHDRLAEETKISPEERERIEQQLTILESASSPGVHTCRMTSKVGSTHMQLRQLMVDPTNFRGYGLDVKLNGLTSHLILDTTASGILVDRKVAEKAGVKHLAEAPVRGLGDRGPAPAYIGQVDSIQVGDLEFQDCRIRVMESNSVITEEGLIGANVFSSFLVDLDMTNGKLGLSPLPARPDEPDAQAGLESVADTNPRFHDRYIAPEMQSYTRVFRVGNQLLIPTLLNGKIWKLFDIDTGSTGTMISTEAAHEVTGLSTDTRSRVKGLNGSTGVSRADAVKITFANIAQQNLSLIAIDTKVISDSQGVEVSGFLGFSVLRMLDVKIDYRDDLVNLTVTDPNVR